MSVPPFLLNKLQLFKREPDLAAKGMYAITSDVDREVVDLFFARVMGDAAEVVTTENAEQLRRLCEELGFSGFDEEIRAVDDAMTKNDHVVRPDGYYDESPMSSRTSFFQVQEVVDDHERVLNEILVSLRSLHARVYEVEKRLGLKEADHPLLNEIRREVDQAISEKVSELDDLKKKVAPLKKNVEQLIHQVDHPLKEKLRREVDQAIGLAMGKEIGPLKRDISEKASEVDTLKKDAERLKEVASPLPNEMEAIRRAFKLGQVSGKSKLRQVSGKSKPR